MIHTLKRVIKDPVTQTLVLGAVLVVLAGLFRPPEMNQRAGVDPSYLFLNKAHNARDYNIVLAGDSRVYCSLSPSLLSEKLGRGDRIINFAFEGLGYTTDYLERVREVLTEQNPRRAIILGLTPMSLTRGTSFDNGFRSAIRRTGWPLMRDMYMPRFLRFFEPVDWRFMIRWLNGSHPFRLIWHYDADGFVAIDKIPNTQDLVVESFGHRFDGNPVQASSVNLLLEYVKSWTDAGITVYGFRPPTSPEMVAKESEVSGFDELQIPSRFEQAGGVWVDVDQTAYLSYDGNHLLRGSALRFSQDFAQLLRERGL